MVAEQTIPQRELRNNVSDILRRVEEGESFVITVSGRPVAEIRPLTGPPRSGSRELLERIIRDAPLDRDFERDVKGIFGDDFEIR